MIEEESSERMFRIILLSNQKRISLQAVFLLTNLLYEDVSQMRFSVLFRKYGLFILIIVTSVT